MWTQCNTNNSNKAKPNASGFYPTVEWNKLFFAEQDDKIWKEHDKKGEPGGTKHIIGNISIEQVIAIISTMQQVQSTTHTKETELTSITQVRNSFGSKANVKRIHTNE